MESAVATRVKARILMPSRSPARTTVGAGEIARERAQTRRPGVIERSSAHSGGVGQQQSARLATLPPSQEPRRGKRKQGANVQTSIGLAQRAVRIQCVASEAQ